MKSNSGPVNVLPNGMKTETRNPQTVCNDSAVSETREPSSSLSTVRTLPKKRKYDLSTLVDDYSKPGNNVPVSTTSQYASNITPPQSIAVDYSCVGNSSSNTGNTSGNSTSINVSFGSSSDSPAAKPPPKIEPSHIYYSEALETNKVVPVQEYYNSNASFPVPAISVNNVPERNAVSDKPNIALHEWIDHRVLAKRNGVYLPGTIRKADSTVGNIWIEFDNSPEGELILFMDVLQGGRYDVISDASPLLCQVNVGVRVCVRTSGSLIDDKQMVLRVFVEGIVTKILTSPVRFVVRLTGPETKEYVANRADIRLLQPPWSDELEDELPPPSLPYGNIPSSSVSVSNGSVLVTSSNVYQPTQAAPLDAGSSKILCRSAATSPLPGTLHSNCPAVTPGAGVEEQRRRHVDEYSESDDDMRRENIMFSSLDSGTESNY